MIKGVIFDVDGVLLDSMSVWENLGEEYLALKGIKAKEGLKDILETMSMEEGAEYLKNVYHINDGRNEILKEIKNILEKFYKETILLKPGIYTYLKQLKKKNVCMTVATSGDKSLVKEAFQRLGIDGFFSDIITCADVKKGKDHPDIYIEAAKKMNLKPKEVFVFEDAYHAVYTAEKAGFFVVGIYDTCNEKDEENIKKTADLYLENFDDFEMFLEKAEKK